MSEIKIKINGKEYKTKKGIFVLEVARANKIKIPTLCHDHRLEPYSSCYLCVVEIDGMRGLQPSCSTKVSAGMNIFTENEKVKKSRKTALDLLVSDHYASCAAPCKLTCPAGVDVQGYISLIEKGDYYAAIELIKEVNPLPAICGRVCVRPCEAACNRNYMDEGAPVGIDYMKRFVADLDLKATDKAVKSIMKEQTGKKVAIIGAGPGGLTAAYFLQKEGYQCDIFEANNHAGGWLRYGIPEYRLPNDLLEKEIKTITDTGAKIYLNKNLGGNMSYSEIKNKYHATILTIGSQRGTLLRAKGEDADGVFSGIDFLRNMEQTGQKYDFSGKTVAVVGGGNTAMDCCRTSIRCNAENTYIIYRRTEKEMPANRIEIHESKLEGVEYMFLTNPTQVNKTKDGKVKSMTLIKMKLGEPDASGRRRPIPIEGSEFELKVNYILAAIGQKTDVNFIDDINKYTDKGELKLNRWGDIDVNRETLQTGIKNVFAAGDGVTGAATIIEAIAQANIAVRSCIQYLSGKEIKPKKKEFLSKKSNFKELTAKDFTGHFAKQMRKEMPVLELNKRNNFDEVELGYTEEMAKAEANRCFECGCNEYFTCKLKQYSTEYGAEQNKFKGEFHERPVDFSHPYIEIDNNKCILCSRCVRICDTVAGTTALGLVNRGFETFVAPSMGKSLTDTDCESCGLCVSTCPTGAITENFKTKSIAYNVTKKIETINNYGSIGEKINLNYCGNSVLNVTGLKGEVNKDGNIGRMAKFGYMFRNDKTRLKVPMIKTEDGSFKEISFKEAYKIIKSKVKKIVCFENIFFVGARLTVEEQILISKLTSISLIANNLASFHYLERGNLGYNGNSFKNVPFEQLKDAESIYILGAELNYDDQFVSFLVNNAKKIKGTKVELITTGENRYEYKADNVYKIKSYYWFTKAILAYIIKNKLYDKDYIKNNCSGFKNLKRKQKKLKNYAKKAGVTIDFIANFAEKYNKEKNAVIIFSEKNISGNCSAELFNLAMVTGKLGKHASGIVSLKESCNSQGLYKVNSVIDYAEMDFYNSIYKNIFIFGEDPVGCAVDNNDNIYKESAMKKNFKLKSVRSYIEKKLEEFDFVVVQDFFITETAKHADLLLPASLPIEIGGHYVNTQGITQKIYKNSIKDKPLCNSLDQIKKIISFFDKKHEVLEMKTSEQIYEENEIFLYEYIDGFKFNYTKKDNYLRMFNYGCDNITKRFEEEFKDELKK